MEPKIQKGGFNPAPLVPYAPHLIRLQLEPSLVAVMSHPDIAGNSDGTKKRLSQLHLPQPLRGYADSVHHSARQTGSGGRIPGREAETLRSGPNPCFGPAQLRQRRAHGLLAGRTKPGPVFTQIVGIGPIDHGVEAYLSRQRPQPGPQLGFAEVATIGGVAQVARIGELPSVD